MSLIISLVVNDGIVLASDSRTTQSFTKNGKTHNYPLTDNANKTFLARNRYGISMCGEAAAMGHPLSCFRSESVNQNKCCSVVDYKDSWELLKNNNNSLTYCSNLHLLLLYLKDKYQSINLE